MSVPKIDLPIGNPWSGNGVEVILYGKYNYPKLYPNLNPFRDSTVKIE
jgi:hypothetical protein